MVVMELRRYAAECLGAFTLTLAVAASIVFPLPVGGAVAAGLTLGLFVYTVGPLSGAHLNPAITLGLLTGGKIKTNDALLYIVAQLLGAVAAMAFLRSITGQAVSIGYGNAWSTGVAEALGAMFLAIGVCSAAYGKAPSAATGIVVGGSLLLGATLASMGGNGVINPAVALGVGSFGPMYILGPIIGSVVGVRVFTWLYGERFLPKRR